MIDAMLRPARRRLCRRHNRLDAAWRRPMASPALLLFVLMAGRWLSGLPALCHLPYWYLSYTEGFIRRAFIGSFTMPLLVGRPLPQALVMIAGFGSAAGLALIAVLALRFARRGAADPLPVLFLFSGALPWLATDLGTLDSYLVLASFGAFVLVERGGAGGLVLCIVAPLIHEGSLFLLAPLLGGMFVLRPDRRAPALAGLALALAAATALWLFSTTRFSWPAGMPLGVADNFVKWELGQRPHLFAPRMTTGIWLFSILPSLAIAAVAVRRAGWRAGLCVLTGLAVTWSVVPIAIDTARLFAWGPFTALALADLAQHAGASERSGAAPSK